MKRSVLLLIALAVSTIALAQKTGLDAAEFDVQFTSDEKVIVFHGPLIPGLEKSIQDVTFKEARKNAPVPR